MATDPADATSTVAWAGVVVAGLSVGAAYALGYTRLGGLLGVGADPVDARAQAHRPGQHDTPTQTARSKGSGEGRDPDVDAVTRGVGTGTGVSGTTRRGRRGRKGKGVQGGEDEVGALGGRREREPAVPFPQTVPGDLGGVGVDVGSSEPSPAEAAAKPSPGIKNPKKKKQKQKKQKKAQDKDKDGDRDGDEDKDGGSETGKEVDVGQAVARSGDDSTDASVSLHPSASGDGLPGSSRATGKGNLFVPPSQPHARPRALGPSQIRPSLSFDTDSSWTHVDRRRLRTSKSADGQVRGLVDAVDMTSSDLASTASDSPVAERMDNVMMDMRGARADLTQRTLAEKRVPKPKKTGVEDMLETPDFPALARVLRVQPPADETPVPGFSWEDYGDVVEESVLVHDADAEDEGEWGVVKSRHRTRPLQTTTTASASTSTSPAPTMPETMTKKQRQNARKRELAKAAKADAEAVRLEGLAQHKRELERLRVIEQSRQGGGKQPGGGMHATVDDRGKLVWE